MPAGFLQSRMAPGSDKVTCSSDTLALIHGYCAQSNPFSANDFTQKSVFLGGLGQNLSHDQFAKAILAWEAENAWDCFAIVAHSQGGAASLHLLTYYWSGLV